MLSLPVTLIAVFAKLASIVPLTVTLPACKKPPNFKPPLTVTFVALRIFAVAFTEAPSSMFRLTARREPSINAFEPFLKVMF